MEQQPVPGIVKIATKYGLIQGVLAFGVFLLGTLPAMKPTWVTSVINTALLIVLMVLAHREFKRAHDGKMTYGQGLGSGTLLSSAAAVVSCILVYIYIKYLNTGYVAAAMQAQQAALEQRGLTGAQAQQAMAITATIMTPVGIVITSLITGVIAGFVVALVVSIFTQKADPRAVY
jgi:hypothetical protein